MSEELSKRERTFLERVMKNQGLPSPDRFEDRARQRMRKLGYAEMIPNPRRWAITTAGVEALTREPRP